MNKKQSYDCDSIYPTKTFRTLITTTGLAILAGCAEVSALDLAGTYRSTSACAGETLILSDGGSFSHKYSSTNYTGSWSLYGDGWERSITFSPFHLWRDKAIGGDTHAEVAGFGTSVTKAITGKVTIVINDDYECSFTKGKTK